MLSDETKEKNESEKMVVVYREMRSMGREKSALIFMDGEKVGEVENGNRLVTTLAPGTHQISVCACAEENALEPAAATLVCTHKTFELPKTAYFAHITLAFDKDRFDPHGGFSIHSIAVQ